MTSTSAADQHALAMLRGRFQGDRGAVSAELVLVMPLLLLLFTGVVQAVLWSHASHLAQGAAAQGLAAARAYHASPAHGRATAHHVLDQLGPRALTDPHIDVTRDGGAVTVTITGRTPAIVPGLHLSIHASATGPVERLTPDAP